jgi:hypothetical protein
VRGLPESRQAEVVRRLGDPRPDVELARILRAWPRLSPAVRSAVVAVVEGSAAAHAGDLGTLAASKPKGRGKRRGTNKGR